MLFESLHKYSGSSLVLFFPSNNCYQPQEIFQKKPIDETRTFRDVQLTNEIQQTLLTPDDIK